MSAKLFGKDLMLTRTFKAPAEDVWASVTESERTARWFGPWKGEPGPGRTIEVQMVQEEGKPWMPMRIEACEPPQRLALYSKDDYGTWNIEVRLTETGGVTELTFTHFLESTDDIGSVGPGWEWYLDLLVTSREGNPPPSFDDYYPARKEFFEGLR